MNSSLAGTNLIKSFEGHRLRVYDCPAMIFDDWLVWHCKYKNWWSDLWNKG